MLIQPINMVKLGLVYCFDITQSMVNCWNIAGCWETNGLLLCWHYNPWFPVSFLFHHSRKVRPSPWRGRKASQSLSPRRASWRAVGLWWCWGLQFSPPKHIRIIWKMQPWSFWARSWKQACPIALAKMLFRPLGFCQWHRGSISPGWSRTSQNCIEQFAEEKTWWQREKQKQRENPAWKRFESRCSCLGTNARVCRKNDQMETVCFQM